MYSIIVLYVFNDVSIHAPLRTVRLARRRKRDKETEKEKEIAVYICMILIKYAY